MLLLNTCSTGKIQLLDSDPLLFFSLCVLNPNEDTDLRIMDNILVDKDTAEFLREFRFSWIGKERIYGIKIEADKETCRAFLRQHLGVDGEVFLKDE